MKGLLIFWVFFKIGLITFGGGQAMIPIFQQELVDRWAWIDMPRFLNIVAVSQLTPGPIAINVATFVGLQKAGLPGAVAGAFGVVMPSFLVILVIAACFHRKFRDQPTVNAFLEGIRPVVFALLVYADVMIARHSFASYGAVAATLGLAVVFWRWNRTINPLWVVAACGLAGIWLCR